MIEKLEKIEYTREELDEINRIVGIVTGAPAGDLPEEIEPVEMEGMEPGDLEEAEAADEMGAFAEETDVSDIPSEDLDALTGFDEEGEMQAEDITDFIEEIDEAAPPEVEEPVEFPAEDIGEPDFEAAEELPGIEERMEAASPLDELDALTADEPESLDTQDLAPDDTFVGGFKTAAEEAPPVELEEEAGEISDIGGLDDLAFPTEESGGVSMEAKLEEDIPDLSDLSLEEPAAIPESADEEIPEFDIGDLGGEVSEPRMDEGTDATYPGVDDLGAEELSDDELSSISEIEDFAASVPDKPAAGPLDDIAMDDIGVPDVPEFPGVEAGPMEAAEHRIPDISEDESLDIEMLDDDAFVEETGPAPSDEGVDLSPRELNKFKKAVMLFNPAVREAVKNTVVKDLLPPKEEKQLVNMIISGKSEANVQAFLEKKLKRRITLVEEAAAPGRRVITARPEYTIEGRERQKRLLKVTRIFGIAALVAFALGIVGYQFIFKPIRAKNMIREGVTLIRRGGDYLQKPKDYSQAEDLFRYVDDNYIEDFVYGYTEYARAYFDKAEYSFSLDKLNKIYAIQVDKGKAIDIDVLNELGYFYSRVPAEYYARVKSEVDDTYYKKAEVKKGERSQLDVAIEFFKRVLLRDEKNIKALYGIGNAYFYQGQYLNAKKYYEDILHVDPESPVGYSGLLNLYIDRDSFLQVVSVNSELQQRDMLDKVPSALLAKLASYYLEKRKTDSLNVRVDYGVMSDQFKDMDDNIFPAVRSVLAALNKRDKDYPPLHLQYARLSKAENNLKVMKIYLDKAEKLSKQNYNADYFGALSLTGEYYYTIKEPVKAYEYLNQAIRSYDNQPEFTRDDFYYETESLGKTYALVGNIFYYFFDKVRARYGDLEDEIIEGDMDKLANYTIAREKYETALGQGYESSELHYNLGRIYYLNKLYQKSLEQWLNLYEDFMGHPELIFALGNAFYHMGNFDASKGEYLKLISMFEREAEKIKLLTPSDKRHVTIFRSLASSYNNLGAVYQLQNNEAKSSISYWKAIDYAKRIGIENEFARVNLARSFKPGGEVGEPILDEDIPFSIDIYREEMRY